MLVFGGRRRIGASSLGGGGGGGGSRSVFDVLPDILSDDGGYASRRLNNLAGSRSLNAIKVDSTQLREALEQIETLQAENESLKVGWLRQYVLSMVGSP